jgi:hypothetical protein
MIHLTSVDTEAEADDLQLLFEASGIPIFVQSDFTREDPANRFADFGYRIHIWIDEQLEDAKRLIKDSDHQVRHPVDVQQFYAELNKLDEEREAAFYKAEKKWLNWLFGLALAGIVGWGIYTVARA